MTTRRMMLYLAAALATSACGDGTGPGLPSRYELASLDGQPLPATWAGVYVPSMTPGEPEVWCEIRLTYAQITFGNGGRYVATSSTLRACADGRPDLASAVTETGSFTLGDSGAVLMRADAETPNGMSEHEWYATRAGRELRVTSQDYGSGYGDFILETRTYVYRVVP